MFFIHWKNKLLTHSLFWVIYFTAIVYLLGSFIGFEKAMLRTLTMSSFHAVLIYVNLLWLMPKYFPQRAFKPYFARLLPIMLLTFFLQMWADYWLSVTISDSNSVLAPIVFTPRHFFTILVGDSVVVLITTRLQLLEDWYKAKKVEQELKSSKLEAELNFLKTQINPHFLFNTLNNLYTLALIQSDKTAPTIMKLSEMMRYMIYESDVPKVPLTSEIHYLKNFIDLQQLKKSKPQQINFTIIGHTEGKIIAPLLFVPFFENAFKHGNLDDLEHGFMKSTLKVESNKIIFTIENTFIPNTQKDKVGGIGLKNTKQRLALMYPNAHDLKYQKTANTFEVYLEIET